MFPQCIPKTRWEDSLACRDLFTPLLVEWGSSTPQRPEEVLPPQQMHLLSKGMSHQRPPHQPDSFPSMPMGDGPDLSEVIRPTHTGIPEFDLSRIIPADKPSSTLQYFPKSESMSQPQQNPHQVQLHPQASSAQLLKQLSSSGPPHSSLPSSNPHIANLQNMMAEQQLPLHPLTFTLWDASRYGHTSDRLQRHGIRRVDGFHMPPRAHDGQDRHVSTTTAPANNITISSSRP